MALIDERFRMHERRAERIHRLIAEQPRTAHEIAQELWGNVAVTQAYLTLSEVLGHVDLLLRDGRAVEEERDGVVRFRAASARAREPVRPARASSSPQLAHQLQEQRCRRSSPPSSAWKLTATSDPSRAATG